MAGTAERDLALLRMGLRGLERATRALATVQRAALPQVWDAEKLEARYSTGWAGVKALFRIKRGMELGDRRTARVSLLDVLELDEMLERERADGGENRTTEARRRGEKGGEEFRQDHGITRASGGAGSTG